MSSLHQTTSRQDHEPTPSPSIAAPFDQSLFDAHPALQPLATEILWQASHVADAESLLVTALPAVLGATGGDYLALVAAETGRWSIVGDSGRPRSLPIDLLAESLDREDAVAGDDWAAVPLGQRAATVRALVLHVIGDGKPNGDKSPPPLAILKNIAPLLDDQIAVLRQRYQQTHKNQQRLERLEAIVKIAQKWSQNREMEPLLLEMAEAATRLLGADRASIFLWDRPNHTLVGRPALGVEGNELRIPDNAGVVGKVIRSGKPQRANVALDSAAIDKKVDSQLGYQTKTLLCVPLRDSGDELFGAFELINKISGSFNDDDEEALTELAAQAAITLEATQDRQQLISDNRQIAEQAAQGVKLVGQSPQIEAMRSIISRVAGTDLAVLVLGENGTGKEIVAQSVHYLSGRSDKPFITVNCAAIPDTLAESELFGHEKGAFTDAQEVRQGKFELADQGTLFLDEIGDLSLGSQAKLLRVLEEKVIIRVGGSTPIHTDARVLAATNQNLAEMVREKRFREDLYFRLNVVTIELPSLRDRGDDITLLADYFLDEFCKKARRNSPKFSPAARRRLQNHPWPGNVRELRNMMERLAFLFCGDHIEAEDLAFTISPQAQSPGRVGLAAADQTLAEGTADFQIEYIEAAIEQASGNVSQAAAKLGLHRSNLYRKMRQLGMDAAE